MEKLTFSVYHHPWTRVLSDSSLTATFACISPHCFESTSRKCPRDEWKPLQAFSLSTKLEIFHPYYLAENAGKGCTLQRDKAYWINSPKLNLLANVISCRQESGTEPVYHIAIKRSRVPSDLLEHIRKEILREVNESRAFDCIISDYNY